MASAPPGGSRADHCRDFSRRSAAARGGDRRRDRDDDRDPQGEGLPRLCVLGGLRRPDARAPLRAVGVRDRPALALHAAAHGALPGRDREHQAARLPGEALRDLVRGAGAMKAALLLGLLLLAAEEPGSAQPGGALAPCADDVKKLCADAPPGATQVRCLTGHESELSAECKERIAAIRTRMNDLMTELGKVCG